MDLDAILFFYNKFNNSNYNLNDIMIMSSYIYNNLININKSIIDNLIDFSNENEGIDVLSKIDFNNEVLNTPIYKLMMDVETMHITLVTAIQKKLISDEVYRDILEILFDKVGTLEEDEENKVLLFLIDILQVKRNISIKFMQESIALRKFVVNNKYALSIRKKIKNSSNLVQKKMIIIRLFGNGYVKYGDILGVNINYEDIIEPLINTKNFGHLRLVINGKAINPNDADLIMDIIDRCVNEVNSNDEEFDDEQAIIVKNQTHMMLNLIRDYKRNV